MTERPIPTLTMQRPIINVKTGAPTPWFAQAWNDMLLRTGGETVNAVAQSFAAANESAKTAEAIATGAIVTGYTLTPSSVLSDQPQSTIASIIAVREHVRSEGGLDTSMPAGVTSAVQRGETYVVYYQTPGSYLASANSGEVAADPANKVIGAIYIALPPLLYGGNTGETGV